MKKALTLLASLMISVAAYGQGAAVFNTVVGPSSARTVDAPVRMPDGTTAPGVVGGFTAQLFLKQGDSYTALTPATTFRSDVPAAGFYVVAPADAVTVPGFAPGSDAPLVLRAWQTAAGSFDAALTRGESAVANIRLGGGDLPPTNLIGLQGFTMTVIPEPSTIALGVLGAAALLLRRRK